ASLCVSHTRAPPRRTLFPYTALFRSESKDRDIAMVFQSYALYPHMTVRANMAFSLKLRNADAAVIAERVAKASKILNLDAYLERDRKSTRLNSSHVKISYAVFCLKKK